MPLKNTFNFKLLFNFYDYPYLVSVTNYSVKVGIAEVPKSKQDYETVVIIFPPGYLQRKCEIFTKVKPFSTMNYRSETQQFFFLLGNDVRQCNEKLHLL
jgi:hypothetical protein